MSEEDLYNFEVESLQGNLADAGIPNVELITEEFERNINHRGNAYEKNKLKNHIGNNDDVLPKTKERSSSLYCRSSECEHVNLQDF